MKAPRYPGAPGGILINPPLIQAATLRAQNAAKNPLYLDPFSRHCRGDYKCAKIEASFAGIRAEMKTLSISDDCAAISGESWGNHGQSAADPVGPLSGP